MSSAFDHPGFEDSILYSDDDYEPYGYASLQLQPVAGAHFGPSRFGKHERVIEAAVLRRIDISPDY